MFGTDGIIMCVICLSVDATINVFSNIGTRARVESEELQFGGNWKLFQFSKTSILLYPILEALIRQIRQGSIQIWLETQESASTQVRQNSYLELDIEWKIG
ncbi:25201_t:CDS:2 [Dentiscutata erythropus]|uniref:25201_t:CDS:1 n=1 Tax=Dentiscutata erythropus TaxID=1348616 RepID=A0A9N8WDF4_9GLOM|nr:25201_t:CDS:2 [Dentiscutata erythropus]